MRRMMAALGALLALGMAAPSAYAAATPAPIVTLEMLILIPQHHTLAVFQQMALSEANPAAPIAILPGARQIAGIGSKVSRIGPDTVMVRSRDARFALRYTVPWNGRSAALGLVSRLRLKELLVLTPPNVVLPPVLNPVLAWAGQGRIPLVPNSPAFEEYGTQNVAPGQSLPIVLEHRQASSGPVEVVGNHPAMALVFELLAGLIALLGIGFALNWRPVREKSPEDPERYWAALAALVSAYRRGEVAESEYQRDREQLTTLLTQVGEGPPHG